LIDGSDDEISDIKPNENKLLKEREDMLKRKFDPRGEANTI
jgi:hypothetical protein